MWFYTLNNQQIGPFTEAEMKELFERLEIDAETPIKRLGEERWTALGQTELGQAFGPAPENKEPLLICSYSGKRILREFASEVDGFLVATDFKEAALNYVQQGGWLPTEESKLRASTHCEWSYLASRALRLLKSAIWPAILIHLAVNIPLFYYCQSHALVPTKSMGLWADIESIGYPVGIITAESLSFACILFLLSRHARQQRPGAPTALTEGFDLWGLISAFLVGLMAFFVLLSVGMTAAIALPFGFDNADTSMPILCLIMMFIMAWISFRVFLAPFAIVDRGMGLWQAVKFSIRITRSCFKLTLGVLLFTPIAIELAGVFIVMPTYTFLEYWRPGFVATIPLPVQTAILSTGVIPWLAMLFCYYKALEVRFITGEQ